MSDELTRARKAIESLILHGDSIPGTPDVDGTTFVHRGIAVRYEGYGRRQIWSDAEDGWVWRHAPNYSLPVDSAPVAPKPVRYAIRADFGKGFWAVAGQRQAAAATSRPEKASVWATRDEALAALAEIASVSPGYFGPKQDAVIVEVE